MTLPFTIAEFLQVFESYNGAIWPVQVLAYLGGAAVIGLIAAGIAAILVLIFAARGRMARTAT